MTCAACSIDPSEFPMAGQTARNQLLWEKQKRKWQRARTMLILVSMESSFPALHNMLTSHLYILFCLWNLQLKMTFESSAVVSMHDFVSTASQLIIKLNLSSFQWCIIQPCPCPLSFAPEVNVGVPMAQDSATRIMAPVDGQNDLQRNVGNLFSLATDCISNSLYLSSCMHKQQIDPIRVRPNGIFDFSQIF